MAKIVLAYSGTIDVPSIQRNMKAAADFIGLEDFEYTHFYLQSEDSELCVYASNPSVLNRLMEIIKIDYDLSESYSEIVEDVETLFKGYIQKPNKEILQIEIPDDTCSMILNIVLTASK